MREGKGKSGERGRNFRTRKKVKEGPEWTKGDAFPTLDGGF